MPHLATTHQQTKKIVVVGGGTGTSVVLSALKNVPGLDLSAVVVVSDNGGSTGKLRDEFGFLPVGDVRQCLAALANGKNETAVRELLLYRFAKGSALNGHNLGNLVLTALEDLSDSPGEAIETAGKIFGVKGAVYPVTESIVQLEVTYEDGSKLVGEKNLDDSQFGGRTIDHVALVPAAPLYAKARKALLNADQIILGPGDLYGSLLPNAAATNFPATLRANSGQFIYIINLMTHFSQTHNLTATGHIEAISRHCGRVPDVVIMNTGKVPTAILKAYEEQHEFPLVDDLADWHQQHPQTQIVRGDFIAKVMTEKIPGDKLARSLLRHDGDELQKALLEIT